MTWINTIFVASRNCKVFSVGQEYLARMVSGEVPGTVADARFAAGVCYNLVVEALPELTEGTVAAWDYDISRREVLIQFYHPSFPAIPTGEPLPVEPLVKPSLDGLNTLLQTWCKPTTTVADLKDAGKWPVLRKSEQNDEEPRVVAGNGPLRGVSIGDSDNITYTVHKRESGEYGNLAPVLTKTNSEVCHTECDHENCREWAVADGRCKDHQRFKWAEVPESDQPHKKELYKVTTIQPAELAKVLNAPIRNGGGKIVFNGNGGDYSAHNPHDQATCPQCQQAAYCPHSEGAAKNEHDSSDYPPGADAGYQNLCAIVAAWQAKIEAAKRGVPECLICGKSGHVSTECPTTPETMERLRAENPSLAAAVEKRSKELCAAFGVDEPPWLNPTACTCPDVVNTGCTCGAMARERKAKQ